LEAKKLEPLLRKLGQCDYVGKQFGVYKLWIAIEGKAKLNLEIDIALPRTEIKAGHGHVGFTVQSDPFIMPEQASLRRDFTINAMMFDAIEDAWLDLHNGQMDLHAKLLRHVSSAFVEDPLRPLRAMQLAARFGLKLDSQTAALCAQMLSEASSLPTSRIWQEWKKWALAPYPSFGLNAFHDMGWLPNYSELNALIDCPQDKKWHPEGDVWTHTKLVLDAMASICDREQSSADERLILMLAALVHDLGKPQTTRVDAKGHVSCVDHEHVGVEIARDFLFSLGCPKKIVAVVMPLVAQHVLHFAQSPEPANVRHLAHRLYPANIHLWEMLTEADAAGCPPLPASRPALIWRELALANDCLMFSVKPIVTGKMLLIHAVSPSPRMGELLNQAYLAQMNGYFTDEASAHRWLEKTLLQERV